MNNTEAIQTAETIFQQLGGKGRLTAFVAAKNFAFRNRPETEQVEAQFKFKACNGRNTCKVIYNRCPDTYTVEFWNVRGVKTCKKVSSFDNIYCDQLVELFENETKLYLHF